MLPPTVAVPGAGGGCRPSPPAGPIPYICMRPGECSAVFDPCRPVAAQRCCSSCVCPAPSASAAPPGAVACASVRFAPLEPSFRAASPRRPSRLLAWRSASFPVAAPTRRTVFLISHLVWGWIPHCRTELSLSLRYRVVAREVRSSTPEPPLFAVQAT